MKVDINEMVKKANAGKDGYELVSVYDGQARYIGDGYKANPNNVICLHVFEGKFEKIVKFENGMIDGEQILAVWKGGKKFALKTSDERTFSFCVDDETKVNESIILYFSYDAFATIVVVNSKSGFTKTDIYSNQNAFTETLSLLICGEKDEGKGVIEDEK